MKKFVLIIIIFIDLIFRNLNVSAQEKEIYTLEKTIPLAGISDADYLYTDVANRRLYVSHRFSVHILDLDSEKEIGLIENLNGVHGITVANKEGKGFISEGKGNSVKVFDINNFKIIKSISVNGKNPDGICFDPFSNCVFTWNGNSGSSSVIDAKTLEEKATIYLGGRPEFGVSDGMGKVFDNNKAFNSLTTIDSKTDKVIDTLSLLPYGEPTASCYDSKNKRVFSGCRLNKGMLVIDPSKNKVIASLPICSEVDAIRFDEKTGLIFCSGDGTMTIIKQLNANKYEVVQTLTTGIMAKTMEIDRKTHKLYVSIADYEADKKKILPNTMRLLVYKMNSL